MRVAGIRFSDKQDFPHAQFQEFSFEDKSNTSLVTLIPTTLPVVSDKFQSSPAGNGSLCWKEFQTNETNAKLLHHPKICSRSTDVSETDPPANLSREGRRRPRASFKSVHAVPTCS